MPTAPRQLDQRHQRSHPPRGAQGAGAAVDPHAVMLGALAWLVADDARAQALLDVTGLAVDDLRRKAGDADVLTAVAALLLEWDADIVAAADALGIAPGALVAAAHHFAPPWEGALP